MKTLIAALGIMVMSSAALAQNAQPLSGPPASGGAPQQQAPAAGTAAAQPRTVTECREEARNQRLRGEDRKKFVRDCARQVTASCRAQARSQRIDREARRDFMTTCMGRPPRNAQRRGNDGAMPSGGTQAPEQAPSTTPAPR